MTSKQSPAYSVCEQATSLERNPCFIHHHLIPGLRPSSLVGTKGPLPSFTYHLKPKKDPKIEGGRERETLEGDSVLILILQGTF